MLSLEHLTWLDAVGPTAAWVTGVPPAKVAHFAAKARVTNAGDMCKVDQVKRVLLVAYLMIRALAVSVRPL